MRSVAVWTIASLKPMLRRTFSQIGYWSRDVSGVISFCPPPIPSITPVR